MGLEIKQNELLKNHSTFKIGGEAKYFAVAKTKGEILEGINLAKKNNLPLVIIGGGSNILFRDEGFDGLIIKSQISNLKSQNFKIIAGAGTLFSQLINFSIQEGLSGLEWGAGIPGTVGGGVAGNCGAYGHSISENVSKVFAIDMFGNMKEYSNQECGFSYRQSRFKNSQNGEIILEAEFELQKGDANASREELKKILFSRKDRVPKEPSIGSIFKNIIIDELKDNEKFLSIVPAGKIKGGKFPVSCFIEQCGLKGKIMGGAQISEQHANFIVNIGNAKSKDVLDLISLCKEKVGEKFGIELEPEIVII